MISTHPPAEPRAESELPRYGIEWTGPTTPISVPMADGFWTPWHLAEAALQAERARAQAAEQERDRLREALVDLLEQLKKGGFVNEHGDAMELFVMDAVHAALSAPGHQGEEGK